MSIPIWTDEGLVFVQRNKTVFLPGSAIMYGSAKRPISLEIDNDVLVVNSSGTAFRFGKVKDTAAAPELVKEANALLSAVRT